MEQQCEIHDELDFLVEENYWECPQCGYALNNSIMEEDFAYED